LRHHLGAFSVCLLSLCKSNYAYAFTIIVVGLYAGSNIIDDMPATRGASYLAARHAGSIIERQIASIILGLSAFAREKNGLL
jgi:hypothetical protein